jgi:hypothetical protein
MSGRMPSNANGEAHYDAERAVRSEKCVLGSLLEAPALWREATGLDAEQFLLADHRKIFSAISFLNERGCQADIGSVLAQVGETVATGDLAAIIDGVVPENFRSYIRLFRESTRDRQFQQLHGKLADASTVADRLALLDEMRKILQSENDDQNWRGIFHAYEEFENAPPLRFAIEGFLQEAGVTLIGGLSGHGKTFLMLAIVKSLLEQSPLFGYAPFSVPSPAKRLLYLIPESSIGPFWSRIQLFRLNEFCRTERLLVRTLSCSGQLSLNDPRLLKAAEGADVILDTAVRFMDGSENDVESTRPFADTLFRLLNAGARSITGAHHSPKGFEGQDHMTLENILRGSGDLGAMLCTAWGVRQIDAELNQLYVQNVKPRDFQPCAPFILEGRPHLDETGQFKMLRAPGETNELRAYLQHKSGRPAEAERAEKLAHAASLKAQGKSLREIAGILGVSKSCVSKWLV